MWLTHNSNLTMQKLINFAMLLCYFTRNVAASYCYPDYCQNVVIFSTSFILHLTLYFCSNALRNWLFEFLNIYSDYFHCRKLIFIFIIPKSSVLFFTDKSSCYSWFPMFIDESSKRWRYDEFIKCINVIIYIV